MKLINLTFAILLSNSFFAQLSLSRSEMLPYGSYLSFKDVANVSVLDTNIQGENVTWDFSSFTNATTQSGFNITVKSPSDTPYESTFANANYVYHEQPNNAFRYFNLTNSTMERVGSYSNGNTKIYNDPQVEYVFPMVYGVDNTDLWDNSSSSSGGSYRVECIGTGILKLPSSSHSALFCRVTTEESFFEINAYFWYSADNGSVLLQYIVGDGFFIGTSVKYLNSSTLGQEDVVSNVSDFKVLNPVNEYVIVNFTNNSGEELVYLITDVNGREVLTNDILSSEKNVLIKEDFSNYKSGMYFISIKSKLNAEIFKTSKFIKM